MRAVKPESWNLEAVERGVSELGLDLTPQQTQQLHTYVGFVMKWNKTTNLISRQDIGRFVSRHLLDSLSICPWLDVEAKLADVGSGGGLPGIPLAIASPDREVFLLERSDKKIRFLKHVVREMGLKNVQIVAGDAADFVGGASAFGPQQGEFGGVVSRAVMPVDALWELASPLLADAGCMVLHEATSSAGSRDWELGHSVTTQRHAVRVPGVQSEHQILVISRRTS